jgi:hypothetical protein
MIATTIIGERPATQMRESVHPACTADNKEFGGCARGEIRIFVDAFWTAEFRPTRTLLSM